MCSSDLAQDVDDVLDSTYVAVLPQDIELFKEKNKYMMAVFNSCVQTDFGKTLIRKFEGTHNAQQLFLELEHHAKTSTSTMNPAVCIRTSLLCDLINRSKVTSLTEIN